MKPIVGITAEVKEDGSFFQLSVYAKTITQAGGIPVLIPLVPSEDLDALCQQIDALFVSGGEDIDPAYYGQNPHVHLGKVTPQMDEMEHALIQKILELDKPYLGVCRGMHMLNIVNGGSLYQSIHAQHEKPLMQHKQKAERTHRSHPIEVVEGSQLFNMIRKKQFKVNSFHHQACDEVKSPLTIVARAADGIIEAIESTEHSFVYGFQWHPEEFALAGDEDSQGIFNAFIQAAKKRK